MLVGLLPSVAGLLLVSAIFICSEIVTSPKDTVRDLSQLADVIGGNSTAALNFNDANVARDLLNTLKANPHIRGACIYDAKGNVFAKYPADFQPPAYATEGAQYEADSVSIFRRVMSGSDTLGTVYLQSDKEQMEARLHHIYLVYSVSILLCLVLCWAVSALVGKSIRVPLEHLVSMLRDIAEGEGDLTCRLDVHSTDEIGEVSSWFNQFMDKLQQVMRQVADNTQNLATAAEEMSASVSAVAQGADHQQSQTSQIATAMRQMASTVTQVSDHCQKAADNARESADNAREGGKVVAKAVGIMTDVAQSVDRIAHQIAELGKRSDQIGRIVGVINEIADQTNLLALNAAIEAARAGEQGRGFAVVADEVRKLAERTTKATKEIAEMIATVQQETQAAVEAMGRGTAQVQQGVTASTEAGAKLQQIIKGAEQGTDMVVQIATATSEQTSTTDQINTSVTEIAKITQEAAAGMRQSAKACEEVSNLALDLQTLVSRFKVGDDAGPEKRRPWSQSSLPQPPVVSDAPAPPAGGHALPEKEFRRANF